MDKPKIPIRDPWLRKQLSGGAGKGDAPRPVDKAKFEEGYDRIFGRCSTHPDYKALREPTADCVVCRRLWREAKVRREEDRSADESSSSGR